ncbi:MAG: insulinase family protein [Desulfobacteraceae bacterium]|nr:insulinase family protein [Desulfobacteraceae bacterium]
MTVSHGFELISEQTITEYKTLARFYRHKKTRAELLSLSNDDDNKVFGITFRTPPTNSTGVAHILEHSVLCGSRKYPVKEPFVELLKGSLNTFLNAFTYPDKTCYPVASQNLQDFYNLIDVYLDAVFYPRITPFIFQQEGWHFELEKKASPLIYKGVVFNEMKGAYSSPENVLAEYSLQSLFPDNPYGFDSGGDPKQIPNLTFEQFEAFHRAYYHPSNARIYFYGDDDPEERLKFLNESLKDFDPMEVNSTIPLQSPFDRPRRIVRSFIVGDEDRDKPKKGMFTLNWVLAESEDVQTNFTLHIIEYILLGMPASPLRKALIDSGLGEDVAGEGLGTELRQIYFSTGLKGIDMENVDRIESLVMETLETLARKGIDPRTIEAALNTIEFRLRENNTGHFPRGLSLMLRSLTTWLYDSDPLALLKFEAPLDSIKAQAKSNTSFFEEIIEDLFLKNYHCTTLILKPDPALREKEEAAEKERLSTARSDMSSSKVESVMANTRELKRLQKTPDPPEVLATIPVLKLADLDRKNKTIPLTRLHRKGSTILFHDLFTNGIAYLDIGFDLHNLPHKYLQYVPLLGRALVEIGTEKEDFVTLTQRISRKTGGIRSQIFTSTVKHTKRSAAWLFLRGKAMLNQTEELTRILKEVLLTVRLDNQERFRQMVLEEKARAEQRLIPSGHQFVNLRLRAHFGESHWAAEQMGGISYLFFLRKLIRVVEKNWAEVLATLEEICRILVNRKAMVFNITLDEDNWSDIENLINNLLNALPETPVVEAKWSPDCPDPFEGMTIPSKVNYVGKGANIFELGYRFHGSSLVITRYLRNSWLWEQVRVQGGAYGAFCLFDRNSGVLTFVSYRDPNIIKTLEAFDQTASFLSTKNLGEKELAKGIIGAIGDLDAHMLPDAKGYTSMIRYLTGDTEEDRQQMRDEILGTRTADFNAFAKILEKIKESGIVKLLGSPSAIEAVMADRSDGMNVFEVL